MNQSMETFFYTPWTGADAEEFLGLKEGKTPPGKTPP